MRKYYIDNEKNELYMVQFSSIFRRKLENYNTWSRINNINKDDLALTIENGKFKELSLEELDEFKFLDKI